VKKKFADDPNEPSRATDFRKKEAESEIADPDVDEETRLYNDVSANAYEVYSYDVSFTIN
jgi:hypothetical protein